MMDRRKILLMSIICFHWEMAGSWALPPKKKNQVIKEYLNIHRDFYSQNCREGTLLDYYKHHKNFLGTGYFIPVLEEKLLDGEAVQYAIATLKNKISWIQGQVLYLEKQEAVNPDLVKENFSIILERVKLLLRLKQRGHMKVSTRKKYAILLDSRTQLKKLKRDIQTLIEKIPYLLSYQFPVDHFTLRKRYDFYRTKADLKSKKIQNLVFMNRKMVEDGAQGREGAHNDQQFRALLSTLYLRLNLDQDYLSEDLRYDLYSVMTMVENQLKRGKDEQLTRMKDWKERMAGALSFYEKLLQGKDIDEKEHLNLADLLDRNAHSKEVLKDFTLKKQKEVYAFWMKRSELMQTLYVLETILYNEVGGLDGRDGLERRDVAYVVLNRKKDPFYSKITKKDSIFPYLQELGEKNLEKHPWLNILFKEGEFSFTYFFIPSSAKIYCPDITREGVFLRKENLQLALEVLEEQPKNFKALRYFSRHSMLGRIDMSTLWNDYSPIPERPGSPAKRTRFLKTLYLKKDYTYFYSFPGVPGNTYHVMEFNLPKGPEIYVLHRDKKNLQFYHYRNPHLFKFFHKKI